MTLLLALLLLQRTYPDVPIEQLATWARPRACVTAPVVYRRKQADEDWHITLAKTVRNVEHKVVVEITPELPLAAPRVGQVVRACGFVRRDIQHGGWVEIHPAVSIEVVR